MAVLDPKCWATLADLKEHLDIDPLDTTKDSFLTNRLNGAFAVAKNYIGYDLNATDYIEDYDGDGTQDLLLRQFPINTLTYIYDDLFRTWAVPPAFVFDPSTLLDPSNYFFVASTGIVTVFQGISAFRAGNGNVRVSYNAGYSVIPYDAHDGLVLLAAWIAQRAGTEGRTAETLGGKSQQYEAYNIPLYIRQHFAPYKKYSV